MPSLFTKVAAAVTPEPSEHTRTEARQQARAKAQPGDWFSLALDHHLQIEDAFREAKSGSLPALKRLALILNGHSQAEETVLYPAMIADAGENTRANMAYDEQVMTKIGMAKLEVMAPQSQKFQQTLEEIRSAVFLHIYQEESSWFPALYEDAGADNARLTQRFREEFERYAGGGA